MDRIYHVNAYQQIKEHDTEKSEHSTERSKHNTKMSDLEHKNVRVKTEMLEYRNHTRT